MINQIHHEVYSRSGRLFKVNFYYHHSEDFDYIVYIAHCWDTLNPIQVHGELRRITGEPTIEDAEEFVESTIRNEGF